MSDPYRALIIAVVVLALAAGAVFAWRARNRRASPDGPTRPTRDSFRAADAPPPPRKRVAVIVNPTKVAGVPEISLDLARWCRRHDWDDPMILTTTKDRGGSVQARTALEAGVDLVVAIGGDGTVRAVGEALVGSGIPLGLVATGTGNLLARNLEVPIDDLEAAFGVALTGRNRRVDTAWLTMDDAPEPADPEAASDTDVASGGEDDAAGEDAEPAGPPPRRFAYFVLAGIGLDATIVDETPEALKHRLGWTAYVPAGVRNAFGERLKVSVAVDGGEPATYRARTVMIGNCGRLTAGITLLPDAEPDDGILDTVVIAPRGPLAWAGVAARIAARRQQSSNTITHLQGATVEVVCEQREPVEVDGDIVGEASRIKVAIEPKSLIVRTGPPAARD